MPLSVLGKYAYILDLHSLMENMISPSNLCGTSLKTENFDLLTRNLILREPSQTNAKGMGLKYLAKF